MVMSAMPPTGESNMPSFLQPIESDLYRLENILSDELISSTQTVSDASRQILQAGGKRLRPSLVILSARACGANCDADRLINVAASTELIHMATLMHDDVIDGASTRRGRVTANSNWGNKISILTGDHMLAKAFYMLSRHADPQIMQALSEATIAMIEGEVYQMELRRDLGMSTASYFSIIKDKTAAFMSACCRIGAISASAPPMLQDEVAGYGLRLGMAFQITDDLLDLIGDPEEIGKPVGGDIREGKLTLPIILTLKNAEQADRIRLQQILSDDNASHSDIEFIRKVAKDTGAIEDTRQIAAAYIGNAVAGLKSFPQTEYRGSLIELANYILHRRS